jgi:hypothetical protein
MGEVDEIEEGRMSETLPAWFWRDAVERIRTGRPM